MPSNCRSPVFINVSISGYLSISVNNVNQSMSHVYVNIPAYLSRVNSIKNLNK